MSSTDNQSRIDRLFDEVVLPLHEKIQREGVELFPAGPDLSRESYFQARTKRRMSREDFEAASYDGAAGLAGALRSVWQNGNLAELTGSAEKQAAVAVALQAEAEAQTDEVSPFIYVMF